MWPKRARRMCQSYQQPRRHRVFFNKKHMFSKQDFRLKFSGLSRCLIHRSPMASWGGSLNLRDNSRRPVWKQTRSVVQVSKYKSHETHQDVLHRPTPMWTGRMRCPPSHIRCGYGCHWCSRWSLSRALSVSWCWWNYNWNFPLNLNLFYTLFFLLSTSIDFPAKITWFLNIFPRLSTRVRPGANYRWFCELFNAVNTDLSDNFSMRF